VAVTQGLVDTSVFVAMEAGRPLAIDRMPAEVIVSVVTMAELRVGVLVADDLAKRSARLSTLTLAQSFRSIPIDDEVGEAWSSLRIELRSRGLRMPVNDSWIAATAIALGVPVVTQDDDYVDVPGLDVIRV
jgi:predicted nucleic acid-binding protein